MTENKKKDKKGKKKGNKKGQKEKEGDLSAGKEKFMCVTVCPCVLSRPLFLTAAEIPESDIQLMLAYQDDSVICPPTTAVLLKLATRLSHG